MSRVWIVIPSYNEDTASVESLVHSLLEHQYSVIVVDDGSTIPLKLSPRPDLYTFRHLVNLGQGASLQTGFEFLRRLGEPQVSAVVTFDSDGQHQVDDIKLLLAAISKGYDIVLGSRFVEGGKAEGIPKSKRLLLSLATIFTKITTGLHISDTHNGLRACSWNGLQHLQITQNRMSHASQILQIISTKKLSYTEVPVHIQYTNYSIRKGQRMTNSLNILWESLTDSLFR